MKKNFNRLLTLILVLTMFLVQFPITLQASEVDGNSIEATKVEKTSVEMEKSLDVSDIDQKNTIIEVENSYRNKVLDDESSSESISFSITKKADVENEVEFSGGDGTETNPYQVATAEQLDAVRKNLSAHYIQIADINLNEYNDWTPIGYSTLDGKTSYFTGTYDGNGYKIFNLSISSFDKNNMTIGLFGSSQGIIKNVYLENCDIDIDVSSGFNATVYPSIGSVVGRSSTLVSGCTATGNLKVTNAYYVYVGGIAGYSTCSNSTNYVNIMVEGIDYSDRSGSVHCGGVIGSTNSVNGTVINCINYGNIVTSADTFNYSGGICGEDGAIISCVNYGDIEGTIICNKAFSSFSGNCNVGGIVGATSSNTNKDCVNFGNIYATTSCKEGSIYAGGIAGWIGYYSSGSISNCYNRAKIIDSDFTAGRIAGHLINLNASDCFSYDETLVNASIPTDGIGANQINGENMTFDEINLAIKPILQELGLKIDEENNDNFFIIGVDSNNFMHDGNEFCKGPMEGGVGTAYLTSYYYYSKLVSGVSFEKEISLLDYMNRNRWEGSCEGLSISLGLANLGLLDISGLDENGKIPSCYNDLDKPKFNIPLQNLINYYHLLQVVGKRPDARQQLNNKKFNIPFFNKSELSNFWQDFFKEVKTATESKIPLLFSFGFGDDGHTVLTCGYDENDEYYIVQLYDCNFSSPQSTGKYIYLFVDKNTYSFYFSMEADYIDICSSYATNDNWSYFIYYDADAWNDFDVSVEQSKATRSSVKSSLNSISNTSITDESEAEFMVDANQPFKITDSQGKYLQYKDGELTGNIELTGFEILGDNKTYAFKFMENDFYTISDYRDDTQFSIIFDNNYFSARTTGGEKILFSRDAGIELSGKSLSYVVGMSVEKNSSLMRITGENSSSTKINYSSSGVNLIAEDLGQVIVSLINENGSEQKEVISGLKFLTLDYNGNQINCEHNPDKAVIENFVPATCTKDGCYNRVIYCIFCGKELSREIVSVPATGHNYYYTDNLDGTHTKHCKNCKFSLNKSHNYVDGICTLCKAREIMKPIYPDKAEESDSPSNLEKEDKPSTSNSTSNVNISNIVISTGVSYITNFWIIVLFVGAVCIITIILYQHKKSTK